MKTSSKINAIETARDIISKKPIYLDTETTGITPKDEIIEVCIIGENNQELINTLVQPISHIPQDATRIHGITNTMVQNAQGWSSIWPEVKKLITNKLVAVYNADFDLRMLQQSNKIHNIPWVMPPGTKFFCIMKLYAQYIGDWNPRYGNYRWHSLESAGLQSNIKIKNTHRACMDTRLARAVLHFMGDQGN